MAEPLIAFKVGKLSCFCFLGGGKNLEQWGGDDHELATSGCLEQKSGLSPVPESSLQSPRPLQPAQPQVTFAPDREHSQQVLRHETRSSLTGTTSTGSAPRLARRPSTATVLAEMLANPLHEAPHTLAPSQIPAEALLSRGKRACDASGQGPEEDEAARQQRLQLEESRRQHHLHPLAAAVRSGRLLEAERQLVELQDGGGDPRTILDDQELERLRRIISKYRYSLAMLETKVTDLEVSESNCESGLEWGISLAGDFMHVVYEMEEDHDIVRAFVGLQERDLHTAWNKGLITAESVGRQHTNDGAWRSITVSKSTGVKGDNIALISSIDALAEPGDHGCIWSCTYSPPEAAEEVCGAPIPEPLEGHARMPYTFWVSTLTPLAMRSGGRCQGYKIKVAIECQLPSMVAKVIAYMPGFVLRRLARAKMEQAPKDFRKFVTEDKEIDDRMRSGPRAKFYKCLREHLAELLPR